MTHTGLSEIVGVFVVTMSIPKNDRARALRYSTLVEIGGTLDCEARDLTYP